MLVNIEHEDTTRLSEPARHLALTKPLLFLETIAPAYSWTIRRIIESLIIAKFRPNLNKQVQAFFLSPPAQMVYRANSTRSFGRIHSFSC